MSYPDSLKTMEIKLASYTTVFLLLAVLTGRSSAATCTYSRSSNRVTCGGVTCSAATPGWFSSKLPSGDYRIGDYPSRSGWFRLYKYSNGHYWDYHTKIPEESCRGGFALHGGSFSEGCITVTDDSCFNRLTRVINRYRSKSFSARECLTCFWGGCRRGHSNVSRTYKATLRAY